MRYLPRDFLPPVGRGGLIKCCGVYTVYCSLIPGVRAEGADEYAVDNDHDHNIVPLMLMTLVTIGLLTAAYVWWHNQTLKGCRTTLCIMRWAAIGVTKVRSWSRLSLVFKKSIKYAAFGCQCVQTNGKFEDVGFWACVECVGHSIRCEDDHRLVEVEARIIKARL